MLFAREGARVALMDRERAAAEETGREIEAAGGMAAVIEGDVSVEDDCQAAVAACRERFGGLDILHHNVGVALGDGWCETIDMSEWERIMHVNAGGALMMAKAALPVLREQGGGAITNVSSIAAIVAGVSRTNNPPHAYKMSKAALNALTVSLAQAYAQHGVRVNAILPGLIDTPMGVDTVARALHIPREQYAALRDESVPLKGGMGSAWDVAHAALFLASDEARFITGVLLPVDGGQSTRVG
jgi:NAD(P)-dependent dehydrogenase (short-subunit alcohol dehydrogenase family)